MAPSLLARLGTATALSNGKVKSRAPPRSLPKRLAPLWATVTVMGDHNTSPPLMCDNCNLGLTQYSCRLRRHEYRYYFFFPPPAECDIIFNFPTEK